MKERSRIHPIKQKDIPSYVSGKTAEGVDQLKDHAPDVPGIVAVDIGPRRDVLGANKRRLSRLIAPRIRNTDILHGVSLSFATFKRDTANRIGPGKHSLLFHAHESIKRDVPMGKELLKAIQQAFWFRTVVRERSSVQR